MRPENTRRQAEVMEEYIRAFNSRKLELVDGGAGAGAKSAAVHDHNSLMYADCPLGAVYASVLVLLTCWLRGDECYFDVEKRLQKGTFGIGPTSLAAHPPSASGGVGPSGQKFSSSTEPDLIDALPWPPLRVLIGSEWPLLETLAETDWTGSPAVQDPRVTCEGLENPLLDWTRFKDVFHDAANWYDTAVRVAYGKELENNTDRAIQECPLGFLMANIVKVLLCGSTESRFASHASAVDQVFKNLSFHAMFGGTWPIGTLLVHVRRQIKRHGFALEFTRPELLGEFDLQPEGANEPSTTRETQHKVAAGPAPSPAFTNLAEALRGANSRYGIGTPASSSPSASGTNIAVTSMVYGSDFAKYIADFLRRVVAVAIPLFVLFVLDIEAEEACRNFLATEKDRASETGESRIECVRAYERSILNKFSLPLLLLNFGYSVLWVDFDTYLLRNPVDAVVKTLRGGPRAGNKGELEVDLGDGEKIDEAPDLLISGSFATECVNSGVVFFNRASAKTGRWLAEVLHWMYDHPYEHDQKTVSAFLFAGERVAFPHQMPSWVAAEENRMRFGYLDSEVEFVTSRNVPDGGWWHRSWYDKEAAERTVEQGMTIKEIPERMVLFHFLHGESDQSLGGHGWTAENFEYVNYFELFYSSEEDGVPAALAKSRNAQPRPELPRKCNSTVPMNY
eukprot:g728.t1